MPDEKVLSNLLVEIVPIKVDYRNRDIRELHRRDKLLDDQLAKFFLR